MQSDILRSMLDSTTNPNIRFIVVCEPIPEETDMKECVEIGYANFNIRDYALGEAKKYNLLPIYDIEEHEEIGMLKLVRRQRGTIIEKQLYQSYQK